MRVFSGLEEPFLDLSSLVVQNPHRRQATILWDVLQDVFRVELFALTASGFHWQHDSMLISVYICCVKPCIFLRVKPAISNFLAPVHLLPPHPALDCHISVICQAGLALARNLILVQRARLHAPGVVQKALPVTIHSVAPRKWKIACLFYTHVLYRLECGFRYLGTLRLTVRGFPPAPSNEVELNDLFSNVPQGWLNRRLEKGV